jgi:hypothetical protein
VTERLSAKTTRLDWTREDKRRGTIASIPIPSFPFLSYEYAVIIGLDSCVAHLIVVIFCFCFSVALIFSLYRFLSLKKARSLIFSIWDRNLKVIARTAMWRMHQTT